jgi:hypothetical protein
MLTFVGEPPDGHEVNHIDAVRTNNRLGNLEYVTPKENQYHARHVTKTLLPQTGEKNGQSVLTEDDVRKIRQLYKEGGYTQERLAKMYGVRHQTISKVINRTRWDHVK